MQLPLGKASNVFRGGFGGDVLTMVCGPATPQEGPSWRVWYDLPDPGLMTTTMEVSGDDGAWRDFINGTCRRQD